MGEKISFGKVVYLDEQAVLDFLQLKNDGEQLKVIKQVSESVLGIEAEASVGKGLFGLAKLNLSGNAAKKKNNIVETQISNTLISSFKKVIEEGNSLIEKVSDSDLYIHKNSPAYYRNLAPMLNMIDDINKLSSFNEEDRRSFQGINIQNMEKTLDLLSGYYEFICETKDKKMILRFNISGLRNNYTLNDLTKMNLQIFGIKVGESKDLNLNFDHQLDIMTQDVGEKSESVIGSDFDIEQEEVARTEENLYPIIDVLMAGV
ncbi:DUF6414 family protein [Enterococcus faecalis]|uniref:DUF6414 family protein n=1 Tax=Enterococcus faecalis TaxID=1351 RepID=UPI0020905EBF|nr:DUF6414 family protein [Enterococcus faecalis]MCO5432989.1 DUF6414 family protein [Enterococcus faecalis]